tara:strand:+ start:1039 stop:1251 length:213 start_codon:yes stop_codon:yes gene_type:complete
MKIIKLIYLTTGILFLTLGIIGLLLPIVPQTAFLIGGLLLIGKGSPTFLKILKNNRFINKLIIKFENYLK